GFTRSLSQSGVGSIMSALWSIDDVSTLELMRYFYKNVSEGLSFAKALQKAKKRLMKSYPDPYHWASFRLIGNGRLAI
ncbi:MAG: CHAT domain-containing protein, partial [Proteobacteria bacterium]|nr:CHAT domain-containing protein [Pseudomonadota bacterium]